MIKIDKWSFGTQVECVDLDIYQKTGKQISLPTWQQWPHKTHNFKLCWWRT